MLRVYILKIANSPVKLQDVFCQVAVEFCMGKRGVGSVYYNSESLQPKKLAECYVKFHKKILLIKFIFLSLYCSDKDTTNG